MNPNYDLSVILLHDQMLNKEGKLVTTSLTLIDVHDIARLCATFSLKNLFVAHPVPAMRELANKVKSHWEEGFGATYNPNRSEALERLEIVKDLDEAIYKIDLRAGQLPRLIATSARPGAERSRFSELKEFVGLGKEPYLLMLGTGWGMSEELLQRADFFLEPISGAGDYNHLSVRSACAIMVDRLVGRV